MSGFRKVKARNRHWELSCSDFSIFLIGDVKPAMPAACQLGRLELAEVVLRVALRGQLNDPSLNLAGG
jgi:hypothetical protein